MVQKPIFTTNVSLLWIFNNARILFIRTWRFIAELFNFNFKTIVTMNDERNWYLYIIQRVYLMRSLYFTQIFNEAINDWVCFFFLFCSIRLLTICKNHFNWIYWSFVLKSYPHVCFCIIIYRVFFTLFIYKQHQ